MLKTRLFALALAAIMIFAVSVFASENETACDLVYDEPNMMTNETRTLCPGHEYEFIIGPNITVYAVYSTYHVLHRTGMVRCTICGNPDFIDDYSTEPHSYNPYYCSVCHHWSGISPLGHGVDEVN